MCLPWLFVTVAFIVQYIHCHTLCVGMLTWQTKDLFFFFKLQAIWPIGLVSSWFAIMPVLCCFLRSHFEKITGLLLAMLISAIAFSTWLFFLQQYLFSRLWDDSWWWAQVSCPKALGRGMMVAQSSLSRGDCVGWQDITDWCTDWVMTSSMLGCDLPQPGPRDRVYHLVPWGWKNIFFRNKWCTKKGGGTCEW